jgi:hypothetical protein
MTCKQEVWLAVYKRIGALEDMLTAQPDERQQ